LKRRYAREAKNDVCIRLCRHVERVVARRVASSADLANRSRIRHCGVCLRLACQELEGYRNAAHARYRCGRRGHQREFRINHAIRTRADLLWRTRRMDDGNDGADFGLSDRSGSVRLPVPEIHERYS
jgi:hypothetical protein